MRGIEGALSVLAEVEKGAFAAEALRKTWEAVEPSERALTATLVYITLRRLGLWRHILTKYCKRSFETIHPKTVSVLIPGIAGVLELEHFKPGVLVNALVQQVKSIKDGNGVSREAALVNAVLHTVMEKAPGYIDQLRASPALRDQALANGVPGWVAAQWSKDWGMKEAKSLLAFSAMQTYLSLRAAPEVDRAAWAEAYQEAEAMPSDLVASSIRIKANPYPPALPGYKEGKVAPQSESSMWIVENLLTHWRGDDLLDMCMGRGVKAGHILSFRKDAKIEGWDLSAPRVQAAQREFRRLGVEGERFQLFAGDALKLQPQKAPTAILLDAPCSGSGTWGRHPEGKWRMTPEKVKRASALQEQLFSRAADLLSPGGILIYCTCSLFREENEKVVGAAVSARSDLTELPLRTKNALQRKGKPYGALMFPELPWVDGFYGAIFRKKNA